MLGSQDNSYFRRFLLIYLFLMTAIYVAIAILICNVPDHIQSGWGIPVMNARACLAAQLCVCASLLM